MCSSRLDDEESSLVRVASHIALPESQNAPAQVLPQPRISPITFGIRQEFCGPALGIWAGDRGAAVLRASMPEASIDEDSYPLTREREISA